MRLGRQDEIIQFLEPNSFTPEVGQGTLALEARSNDSRVAEVLNPVDHGPSGVALRAERAFLAALGGGCEMPVAAYAQQLGDSIEIVAMASTPDGSRLFRTKVTSNGEDEAAAGRRAATTLLEAGAREIIDPPAGR
jgi:hydroxymethylbilane synthase